jgi:hypothetical protein
MPKGHVHPRTVTCKACGNEFVSDRTGKASFYCRTPECDELRKTQKIVVKNTGTWATTGSPRRVKQEEHDELVIRRIKGRRRKADDALVKTELRLQRDIDRMEARFQRIEDREREKAHRAWKRQLDREARAAERERQKHEERVARNRRKANEKRIEAIRKRTRKRGLECFGPIFDNPDKMILFDELMEVMELASVTPSEQIEAKKALVKITRAESQVEQHHGWQLLAAVSLKMADRFRPRQDRDPHVGVPDEDAEYVEDETLVPA